MVIRLLAALLTLGGLVPVAGPVAAQTPLAAVTVVYGVISTDVAYLWMAQDKGFFRKHGLEVNLAHVPTTQAVQALAGGRVHFATTGPQALEAALAGSDTVYILGPINAFVLSVYGRPEVAGIKGLRGKTLGATNKGTPTDVAGRLVLTQQGLTPDTDVKVTYLKELPALVAALSERIIDAAVIPPPHTLRARDLGMKELLNITESKVPFVQHAVATTRAYIRENPEAVRRFVRAAVEALDHLRKNRDDALAVMSKYTKITDARILNEAFDSYEKAWERIPLPSQAAVQAVLSASANPRAKDARWDQFVEDRFVKELVAAGAIK